MIFCVRIANKNILINSVYTGAYDACKDYLINKNVKPDIEIVVDKDSINYEYERLMQSKQHIFSLSVVENLLIHRLIVESLIDYDILLMHGAVIAVDNASYLFTGRSGTGKTTHIEKWLKNAKGSFVVNGDKPFIIIDCNKAFACGTPWCGKENYGKNAIIPLHSIVFMERSTSNEIKKVAFKSIFSVLLEQTYRPTDVNKMKKTLELLMKLKECVTFYQFHFDNYKEDAFNASYDVLTNQ